MKANKFPTPHQLTEILSIKKSQKLPIWGPITRKSITLLYGSTGVGKSFFVLGLLYSLGSEEKFCGYYPQGKHSSCYLDGEMDLEDMAYRLRMIRPEEEMHIACDSINVLTREDFGTGLVPNISIPVCQEMYSQIFAPYDVIIIDNLNTTSYPRNDRDGEIAQFLRVLPWLLKLRDAGKAVILIHHTNKQGQQMGSILKEQIATNVIELEKIKSLSDSDALKFKIVYHKHRHVSKKDAKSLVVEAIPSSTGMTWLTEDPSNQIEDQITQLKSDGRTNREIAEELGIDQQEVYRVVNRNKKQSGDSYVF